MTWGSAATVGQSSWSKPSWGRNEVGTGVAYVRDFLAKIQAYWESQGEGAANEALVRTCKTFFPRIVADAQRVIPILIGSWGAFIQGIQTGHGLEERKEAYSWAQRGTGPLYTYMISKIVPQSIRPAAGGDASAEYVTLIRNKPANRLLWPRPEQYGEIREGIDMVYGALRRELKSGRPGIQW